MVKIMERTWFKIWAQIASILYFGYGSCVASVSLSSSSYLSRPATRAICSSGQRAFVRQNYAALQAFNQVQSLSRGVGNKQKSEKISPEKQNKIEQKKGEPEQKSSESAGDYLSKQQQQFDRNLARAIERIAEGDNSIHSAEYALVLEARSLLDECQLSYAAFVQCLGNAVQIQKHAEIVFLANEFGALHEHNRFKTVSRTMCGFVDAARERDQLADKFLKIGEALHDVGFDFEKRAGPERVRLITAFGTELLLSGKIYGALAQSAGRLYACAGSQLKTLLQNCKKRMTLEQLIACAEGVEVKIVVEAEKTAPIVDRYKVHLGSESILKNGYYEVNGFKFTEKYYNKLWSSGRKAPSLIAQAILDHAREIILDPRGYEGFYKYISDGWYMIYNPITKIVSHLEPLKKI
jgi:hypothetical protein